MRAYVAIHREKARILGSGEHGPSTAVLQRRRLPEAAKGSLRDAEGK